VHLGIAKNIYLGFLPFLGIKSSFFIFLAPKLGFFCEAPTKNMFQKWTTTILENIISYSVRNSPVICMEKVF
jgi:hypothetical protein